MTATARRTRRATLTAADVRIEDRFEVPFGLGTRMLTVVSAERRGRFVTIIGRDEHGRRVLNLNPGTLVVAYRPVA